MTLVILRGSSRFGWDGSNSSHSGASLACSALCVLNRFQERLSSGVLDALSQRFPVRKKNTPKTPDLRSVPKESWHLRTVWPCCLSVFYKWLTERWPKPVCCSSVSLQPCGSCRLSNRLNLPGNETWGPTHRGGGWLKHMRSTLVVTCPAHVWDKTTLWEFSNFFLCVFFFSFSPKPVGLLCLQAPGFVPQEACVLILARSQTRKCLKLTSVFDVAGEQW